MPPTAVAVGGRVTGGVRNDAAIARCLMQLLRYGIVARVICVCCMAWQYSVVAGYLFRVFQVTNDYC